MSNFSEPLSDHLKDIIDEKAKFCRQVQGSMKDEVPNQEQRYWERRSKIESERMKRKRAREEEGTTDDGAPASKKKKAEVINDYAPSISNEQPNNQDYLSYYVYQNEWKPTRPIRPIGAMSSSPGPAIVNLPTTIGEEQHNPTRRKAPGYKIGQRILEDKGQGIGPSPGTYLIRDVTNKGKGAVIAPKFGTAKRFNEKLAGYGGSMGMTPYKRYSREKLIYPRAPTYSVPHAERRETKIETVPSQNVYSVLPQLGKGGNPVVKGEQPFRNDNRMKNSNRDQVIKTEITEVPGENFQDLLNLTDFRGRQENILILKDKLNELQNRIKELEDGNTEKPPEDLAKSTKVDRLEERKKLFQNKKVSCKKHADSRYHKKKKE